jgi:hypothetical protein
MPITTDSIRRDIDARISEVRTEIARLERAVRALTGRATPTSRNSASRDGARPARRRRRAKRVARDQRLGQARELVAPLPGRSTDPQ